MHVVIAFSVKYTITRGFTGPMPTHVFFAAEYSWTYMRADSDGLDEIRRLSEAGKMKIPVEKTFPITEVREAHKAKDKRQISGKVVLEVH